MCACWAEQHNTEWQNKPWFHKSDEKKVHLWFFFCGWRVLFIWPLEHYSVFTKCFNLVKKTQKTIKGGRYCCQVVSCDHGLLDFNRFWFFFLLFCFEHVHLSFGFCFSTVKMKGGRRTFTMFNGGFYKTSYNSSGQLFWLYNKHECC